MTTQPLPVPFGSLNEGDDPKSLPLGAFLRLHNCAMDKSRRLIKRDGTAYLSRLAISGPSLTAGQRLLTNGTTLGLTDGNSAWNFVEALGSWGPIDAVAPFRITKRPLADATRSVVATSSVISGDMLVTIYSSYFSGGGSVYVRVDSIATGATLVPAIQLSGATSFAPVALLNGTTVTFMWTSKTLPNVMYATLDLTTLTFGAVTSLVADAVANSRLDAILVTPTATGVPTIYFAYELAAGANRTIVRSVTASTMTLVNSRAVGLLGTGSVVSLAWGPLAQQLILAFSTTFAVFTTAGLVMAYDLTGGTVTTLYAGASNSLLAIEVDATYFYMGWERDDGGGGLSAASRVQTTKYDYATFAAVAQTPRITYGIADISQAWVQGGRFFFSGVTFLHPYNAANGDALAQPSSVILEIENYQAYYAAADATHPHVGTLESYTGWYSYFGLVRPVTAPDGSTWIAAAYRNREPLNNTSQIPLGWSIYRLALAEADTFRPTAIGAGALSANGSPFWNDGSSVMPYGFAHAPQIIDVIAQAGGSMAVGTYSYVATYLWRDGNGLIHRSSPSPPITGTTAGANLSLQVRVAPSSVSNKQRPFLVTVAPNPVIIELWRTDGIAGSGPHYRLTYEPVSNLLLSDPRAAQSTFVDTRASGNITGGSFGPALATQAQLYTDMGELENIAPPSFITCTTHRRRLVGIGPDLRTLWFSKDATLDATIAPGFNEALTLAFASDKTALQSLDEKLVVFGETTIDVVFGAGPGDDGANNTWDAQRVQTDGGCVNPRSTVSYPMGVMYQSQRGIETLNRDLAVEWTGKAVVDTLRAYPTITSAVLVTAKSEVRFTCTNGSTGVILAWDYDMKTWFTRSYADSAATGTADIPFVDAAVIDGVYTMLTAAGQVYRETSLHCLDAGLAWVTRDIVFGDISPAGSMAWHRVKDVSLMGTSATDHDLEVSFARDYATTYEQVKTYVAQTPVTEIGPMETARITLRVQKRRAVRVRLRDLTPSQGTIGTGAGPTLEGLLLRVGVKPGVAKNSAEKQG